MNKWLVMTCATGAIAMAAVAWAGPDGNQERQGPGPGQEQRHGGHRGGGFGPLLNNPELAAELGVTPEQVTALREAQYEQRKQTITLRSEVQLARLEVKKLMDAEPVDEAAVLAAVDAAGAKATALKKSAIQHMLKVREIVGQETLQKLRAHMRDQFRERRQGFRNEGGGQGPGRGPGPGSSMMDDEEDDLEFSRMDEGPAWMQDEMEPPDDVEDDV